MVTWHPRVVSLVCSKSGCVCVGVLHSFHSKLSLLRRYLVVTLRVTTNKPPSEPGPPSCPEHDNGGKGRDSRERDRQTESPTRVMEMTVWPS